MTGGRLKMRRAASAVLAGATLATSVVPTSTAAVAMERRRFDGWMLTVSRDAFTGAVACRLRADDGRMVYQPGALGFRFGRNRNTWGAWYRIDDGPPQRWQDRYPDLIAADVAIDGPGLDNPTGGIVWLPVATILGARTLAIRPGTRTRVRMFHLRGFAAALAAASGPGCFAG